MIYSKNFIIRRAYLPLNTKINDDLNDNNIKKFSYRTAEFGGFSKTYIIDNALSYCKYGIYGIKYHKNIQSTTNNNIKLIRNPLLVSKGKYYILKCESEEAILEKNTLLTKIFSDYKNGSTVNNQYNSEIIYQLLNDKFLLSNNEKIEIKYLELKKPSITYGVDYRIVNRNIGNKYKYFLKYFKKSLLDIKKVVYVLQNIYKMFNIEELYYCFFEKYNDKKIKIMDFISDNELLNKFMDVSFNINNDNSIYRELIDLIINNFDETRVTFNVNLKNLELKDISFDIYVNLLNINGDYMLCVDTNHYLHSINSSNFISDLFPKGLKLGYFFEEQIKNIFYDDNSNITFLNLYNENSILEDIYIYYSYKKNFFEICDKESKKIKIIKPTKLSIEYFPKVIKNIYKLSDYVNLGLNSTLDVSHVENVIHFPRVLIGNIIFLKESWIFNNYYKTYEIFKEKIKDFFYKYKIPKIITVCIQDYLIRVNIDNDKDVSYLFKMKKSKIIFKEDLQKYSVIIENGYRYSGDAIMSFTNEKDTEIVVKKKSALRNNYSLFSEWVFFEIYLEDHYAIYDETILKLYDFLNKLKINYFYINYMDNNIHTIRLRINKCYKIFEITQYLQQRLKLYFVIKPYVREINKFGCNIYDFIEKHFIYESKSVLSCLKKFKFNNKVEICINFIDIIITEKLNLNSKQIVNFFRKYKYLDVEYDWKTEENIQKYLSRNRNFIKYSKIKFSRDKQKLLNEFIHLLCNRIFGIDSMMELKIRGLCKKRYLERIYRNEKK